MASVYWHHGKRWARFRDESGRWVSRATPYDTADDKRKAVRFADETQRVIDERREAGETSGPMTVTRYAEQWSAERMARGIVVAEADLARLRKYVLPAIGAMPLTAVRPKHARDIVRQLRVAGELAPRTIVGIFRTLRTMFESAVVDELIDANPIKAKPGELPKQRDQDPTWRSQATFTVGEVERLISDPAIPVERRVQYALKAIAGLRHGEVAALRWRELDYTAEPLARIHVVRAYNSATGQLKATKTEDGRAVPMHPTLAKIIATWRLSHWSRLYGRQPTADDLVVPTRNLTTVDASDAVHTFKADLAALGLRIEDGEHRDRGGHDLRSWFITTCQEHGAHRDLLRVVTHTSKGGVVSGYTRAQWPALCAEVAKLRVSLPCAPLVGLIAALGIGVAQGRGPIRN
jgi:integrase